MLNKGFNMRIIGNGGFCFVGELDPGEGKSDVLGFVSFGPSKIDIDGCCDLVKRRRASPEAWGG